MRKVFTVLGLIGLYSCSQMQHKRDPSSVAPKLSGDYLGVSQYEWGHIGPNKVATRIYLQEIKNEPGSYHAILLEYINLLKMDPKYISAHKLPISSRNLESLKNVTDKISLYKIVPNPDNNVSYFMYELHVVDGNIEPKIVSAPRELTLSSLAKKGAPLDGATISSSGKKGQPEEIFFPAINDKRDNGLQYHLANYAYKKAGLQSTWKMSYRPGPYLASYGARDQLVLKMYIKGKEDRASFVQATKYQKKSNRTPSALSKSAYLKGDFNVSEPVHGMFLLKPLQASIYQKTNKEVSSRIGVFIDIFDGSKSLKQDTLEFTLINPEDPKDFLMYFEAPHNKKKR